jgi:hypothetical protein
MCSIAEGSIGSLRGLELFVVYLGAMLPIADMAVLGGSNSSRGFMRP